MNVCVFSHCTRKAIARGFCKTHHRKLRKDGTLPLLPIRRTCFTPDCGKKHEAKGYCHTCYAREIRNKTPHAIAYRKQYTKTVAAQQSYLKYARSSRGKQMRKKYASSPRRLEWFKKWRETPKAKLIAINTQHKRRAQKSATDITAKWLMELRTTTDTCGICGDKLGEFAHLDHIIPLNVGGGHLKTNVRYVHPHCNIRRPKDGSDIAA